jgi:hypothetical protein
MDDYSQNIIKIKNVSEDYFIGYVFNELYNVIRQSRKYDDDVVWDFGDTVFCHPFFLSSLAIYKHNK